MDRTVKEAKGEIESFIQNKIQTFAVKAILEKSNANLSEENIRSFIEI